MNIPDEILFADKLGNKEKIILAILNDNNKAQNPELVEKVHSTKGGVRQTVYWLIRKGLIDKRGYGKYKVRTPILENLGTLDEAEVETESVIDI